MPLLQDLRVTLMGHTISPWVWVPPPIPNSGVWNVENQARRTAACPPLTRVCVLHRRESLCGRSRGLHCRRAVPAAALGVRGAMPGPGGSRRPAGIRGLRALPLPPCPAALLRPRASGAHACAALLRMRRPSVRRATAPDLRARLRVLGPRAGAALLPEAPGPLRAQPPVPVRAGRAGPLTGVRARAGPVSLPSRPRALQHPAPATAARRSGVRVVCAPTQAS